jgi:hypothetical protein
LIYRIDIRSSDIPNFRAEVQKTINSFLGYDEYDVLDLTDWYISFRIRTSISAEAVASTHKLGDAYAAEMTKRAFFGAISRAHHPQ